MAEQKEEKKKTEHVLLVVDEYPTQKVTSYKDEGENKQFELITANEAIQEILTRVRALEKKI